MKTVVLNLPNKNQVVRRYMCSYNAPNFLYPPLELMYISSIVKESKKDDVILIDAIAEKLDITNVINTIKEFNADILITITGFEIFQDDLNNIEKIKQDMPNLKIIAFGYLPTIFPKEVLKNSKIDYIIKGEPEFVFSNLYDAIKENKDVKEINGIAYRKGKKIFVNKDAIRVLELDRLPFPSRELIKNELYSEFLMKKPFTVIQTSRGCPFQCSYCVHTYGSMIVYRSVDNVVKEIEECINKYGIKHFKIIDDTFNVNKQRIKDICQKIIDKGLKIKWICLSRVDTLDKETLEIMKKAGCMRIQIGIESGSQKILELYKKGYDSYKIKDQVKLVHDVGIETMGFFIVGAPNENESDFNKSLELAKEINFDYVVVSQLIPYPGTNLFNQLKCDINFSLFPYTSEFKNKNNNFVEWEKKFYKEFYFRPNYIAKKTKVLFSHPDHIITGLKSLISFLSTKKEDLRTDYY
ncbi:MAG: radical SAM protein [Candidatus Woesearchaeota archaeon]|nr:radical SAM protein [Candidatus Woesearchaeota archaeon]